MQRKIRAVLMRGGTSKGLFLLKRDLEVYPQNVWEDMLLDIFGSPDPMQIDGLGGTHSSTSKLMIIEPSSREGIDIDYTFGQVAVDKPLIDWGGNCGNMTSAVAPFALQEGLLPLVEPVTKVFLYNTNTCKIIEASVPVEGGEVMVEGSFTIAGAPGGGACIVNKYLDPGGTMTPSILPTGSLQDRVMIRDKEYTLSIVDATNPFLFITRESLGLKESEGIDENVLQVLEDLREWAAIQLGFIKKGEKASILSPGTPKMAIISSPKNYITSTGEKIDKNSIDLLVTALSMQKIHHAYPISGAMCTAAAALIEGTVVNSLYDGEEGEVNLGHPKGVIKVEVEKGDNNRIVAIEVKRTARRLMEGYAYFSEPQ